MRSMYYVWCLLVVAVPLNSCARSLPDAVSEEKKDMGNVEAVFLRHMDNPNPAKFSFGPGVFLINISSTPLAVSHKRTPHPTPSLTRNVKRANTSDPD